MTDEQDPWTKKPQREGPPDLDELIRKLRKRVAKFFGGRKGMEAFTGEKQPSGLLAAGAVVTILLIIWFISGFFIVNPSDKAAVLRFGKYVTAVGPGPHWIPRFIDSRTIVNVQKVMTYPYHAEMLTKDENIVSVALAVQYRVADVRNYLFNAVNPNASLQQATASALRQVIGSHTLDDVLTTGREQIREQVIAQLTKILDSYHVGLVIADVALQPAKPPDAVTEAFDDVNRAREDEQRYINEAKAYQQKVVPIAQGQAKRVLHKAEALQKRVVLDAKAATTGFLAVLPQYKKAPRVTRERLYLTTIEKVLTSSSKLLIDSKTGNNLIYLPLDKLFANKVSKGFKTPVVEQNKVVAHEAR